VSPTRLPTDVLLPERARLFHIGPPKTATTAVQAAAAARRKSLLEHGVCYPGRARSHRSAVAAFIGRPMSWVATSADRAPAPDRRYWDELVGEIEADRTRRVLVGHEYAAGADDATARRFVEALGPRTHVVVTLRSYGAMLPSIWQEHNKAGNHEPFDDWLTRVLARPRTPKMVERVHVRHDQGALVRRWADAVGPANLTVVVVDPADRRGVLGAFEAMLGLPDGLLGAPDGSRSNRSLSVPEAELLRRLNTVLRTHGIGWPDYERLVVEGAAARLLADRSPAEGEARLRLPPEAADRADEEARRHVEEIAASGVRVIGDLALLATPAARRTGPHEDHRAVEEIPVDAAVAALGGIVSAACGRGADFAPGGASRPVAERRVCDVTTRDLLGVVTGRIRRRALAVARRRAAGS
jgi:hypothetical protein